MTNRLKADRIRVAVVGSGFAGLGAAIALKRAGFDDVVILERADDVGGVWRDNNYPGAACDVQSPVYSFSFAPSTQWSYLFPGNRKSTVTCAVWPKTSASHHIYG